MEEQGIWVDCIIKVIGWFQISNNLNINTNNYLPETDASGNPVSGDGWVSYEKPGAQPGDIVIIYSLQTIPFDGTILPNVNISNVVWDLINPHGVDYFYDTYNYKYSVNPGDLVSYFPHAAGPLGPTNPDNPLGFLDILWKRATSYYELPGPGNTDNPLFVRQAIPSFGVRVTVWTNNCCIANELTTLPPSPPPPEIPPPPPPEEPGPPTDTDIPNEGGSGGVINATSKSIGGRINSSFGNSNKGDNPSFRSYRNLGTRKYVAKIPGTSPLHWNFDSSYIRSVYDDESKTFKTSYRAGNSDLKEVRNAVPVGLDYQLKYGNNINIASLNKSKNQFFITASEGVLENLGLIRNASYNLSSIKTKLQEIAGSRGSNSNLVVNKGSSDLEKLNNVFNRIENRIDLSSNSATAKTLGGFNRELRSSDYASKFISKIGIQPRNSEVINSENSLSAKENLSDGKGRVYSGLGGITNRGIQIRNGLSKSIFKEGYTNSFQKRIKGIDISKASKSHGNIINEAIKDESNKYSIDHMNLKSVNDLGPAGVLVVIKGKNIEHEHTLILKQSFFVKTQSSQYSIVIASYPMTFGVVNPVTPGFYAIATPICLPDQGSLPDIIANGITWTFSQLISTLQDLEGNIISQQVSSFLPSLSGDADIVSPNKLPVGLMRDLDLLDTSNTTYEGTISSLAPDQSNWHLYEPSVILQRSTPDTNSTVSLVLKSTIAGLSNNPPIRPIIELYNNSILLSSGPLSAFVGGPCSALPGWYDVITGTGKSNGGSHTACLGSAGLGGAGGSSAYIKDSNGIILSGPYNPAVYAGSHQCFLSFKYGAGVTDSSFINTSTDYRLRVYNNGPPSDLNGYGIFTAGLKIKPVTASISVDTGSYLMGYIATNHCNQIIKIRNITKNKEIERQSNHINGNIDLGSGSFAGFGAQSSLRLEANTGDVINLYRPGYDNLYSSRNLIASITV